MADITNLSNFLTDIANAIRTKKETTDTIAAEDFDTEILGITTGGSTETTGVKLFETEESMQADETAEEGDLAIIYRGDIQNMTATLHAQVINFPDTVTLPSAFTSSVYCMFRGETGMADVQVQLSKTRFRLSGYLSSGSVSVNYTSTDGINYTRSSAKDSVDFKEPIYCYYPEEWNDALGYFMQIGGMSFDGLFEYQQFNDENKLVMYGGIYYDSGTKHADEYVLNDYTVKVKPLLSTISTLHSFIRALLLVYKDGKLYVYGTEDNTSNGLVVNTINKYCISVISKNSSTTVYKYELNPDEGTYTEQVLTNSTPSYSGSTTKDFDFGDITDGYVAGINASNIDAFYSTVWLYYEDSTRYQANFTNKIGVSTAYLTAPNQFTLTKSKMLPGVVGYGKNGVITGTDGIYEQLDYDLVNLQTLNKANEFELVQVGPSSMSITPSSSRKSALKDKDYFGFHNEIDLYNTPDFTLYTEEAVNTSTVNLNYAYLDYDARRIYAPVVGTSSAVTRSFKMNVLDMDTGDILNTTELLDETDLSNARVYNLFKLGNYIYLPIGVQSSVSSKDAAVKLYKYDIANNKITIQYKVTTTTLGGGTTSGSYVGTVDASGNLYALATSSGGSSSTQYLSKITMSGSVTRIGTFSNLTNFTRNFFPSKYIMFYDSTDHFYAYDTETNTKIRIPIDYSGSDSSGAPRTVKVFEAGTDTVIVAYFMNDLYVAIIDENKHATAKYQDRTKVSNAEAYATDTVPSVYLETEKVCFVSGRYGMVCIDIENITITTILELDEYNSMYDLKFHKNYVDYKSIRSNTLYSGKCLPIIVEPLLNSDFFAYKSNGQINVRPSDFARLFAESSSDGPISQEEYDVAIDTANEILGEEV